MTIKTMEQAAIHLKNGKFDTDLRMTHGMIFENGLLFNTQKVARNAAGLIELNQPPIRHTGGSQISFFTTGPGVAIAT
jgi:hypothetical protein